MIYCLGCTICNDWGIKMKTVFALMCLFVVGCEVDPVVSQDKTVGTSSPYEGDFPAFYEDHNTGYACGKVDYTPVYFEGHEYWVVIPIACNMHPDIFKGDPAPDMEGPWDNNIDPSIKENVWKAYNIKIQKENLL